MTGKETEKMGKRNSSLPKRAKMVSFVRLITSFVYA